MKLIIGHALSPAVDVGIKALKVAKIIPSNADLLASTPSVEATGSVATILLIVYIVVLVVVTYVPLVADKIPEEKRTKFARVFDNTMPLVCFFVGASQIAPSFRHLKYACAGGILLAPLISTSEVYAYTAPGVAITVTSVGLAGGLAIASASLILLAAVTAFCGVCVTGRNE